MIPTDHEATVAVEAAARKVYEIDVENQRQVFPPGVRFATWDEFDPLRKNTVREHVLPIVWATLAALPDRSSVAWQEGHDAVATISNEQNCGCVSDIDLPNPYLSSPV